MLRSTPRGLFPYYVSSTETTAGFGGEVVRRQLLPWKTREPLLRLRHVGDEVACGETVGRRVRLPPERSARLGSGVRGGDSHDVKQCLLSYSRTTGYR